MCRDFENAWVNNDAERVNHALKNEQINMLLTWWTFKLCSLQGLSLFWEAMPWSHISWLMTVCQHVMFPTCFLCVVVYPVWCFFVHTVLFLQLVSRMCWRNDYWPRWLILNGHHTVAYCVDPPHWLNAHGTILLNLLARDFCLTMCDCLLVDFTPTCC